MGESVMDYKVLLGDNRLLMPQMPTASVRCIVTSPPYWGLRDYGHEDQVGQERTPEEYVANLVLLFREARRVLTDDGTLWLNLGDSYNGSGGAGGDYNEGGLREGQPRYAGRNVDSLKPKDLVGIPWRVALGLQADGWFLRSDIIWHKPNPMPESVTDRPTKAHEYIFLLAKSQRYFYDADAVKESSSSYSPEWGDVIPTRANIIGNMSSRGVTRTTEGLNLKSSKEKTHPTRNRRSVWTVATKPYEGAHFAVFPPELIEPCILAGSAVGDTVLDPFNGSGTTGGVALKHGRKYIGMELNPDYLKLTDERIEQVLADLGKIDKPITPEISQARIFSFS